MNKLNWLKADKFEIGVLIGLIIPLIAALIFGGILRLVQLNFHILGTMREANILLLGAAVNLLVMRYYLIKLKAEKTGKGILLLTVIMILSFFLFLKNSNFAFPF